jgi:predicted ATP-dependent serine protease
MMSAGAASSHVCGVCSRPAARYSPRCPECDAANSLREREPVDVAVVVSSEREALDPAPVTSDASARYVCGCCEALIVQYAPECPSCGQPNAVRDRRSNPGKSMGKARVATALVPERAALDPALVTSDASAGYFCGCCAALIVRYVPECPNCGLPNAVRVRRSGPGRPIGKARVATALVPERDGSPRVQIEGLPTLNRALGGGLPLGQTILLAGPSGAGKSTLLLRIADALGERCVLIASEESRKQIQDRVARTGAGAGVRCIETRSLSDGLSAAEGASCLLVDSLHALIGDPCANATTLREWAQRQEAGVVAVARQTKGGTIRGSADLLYDFDGCLEILHAVDGGRIIRIRATRFGPDGSWPMALGEGGWTEAGPGASTEAAALVSAFAPTPSTLEPPRPIGHGTRRLVPPSSPRRKRRRP